MKNLKFRVWAVKSDDDGCIGFLETRSPIASGIDFFFDGGWRGMSYFLQHPEQFIVQQYTGLKDRNGNEIYEGDIIKELHYEDWGDTKGFNYFGVVVHSIYEDSAGNQISGFLSKLDPNDNRFAGHPIKKDCEVVGNIFENPELKYE